jgi:hypothetical protein
MSLRSDSEVAGLLSSSGSGVAHHRAPVATASLGQRIANRILGTFSRGELPLEAVAHQLHFHMASATYPFPNLIPFRSAHLR